MRHFNTHKSEHFIYKCPTCRICYFLTLTSKNSKISAQELKEVGRDELTGVNLGQVDPATLQATKIACGAHMCGLVRCNYFRV